MWEAIPISPAWVFCTILGTVAQLLAVSAHELPAMFLGVGENVVVERFHRLRLSTRSALALPLGAASITVAAHVARQCGSSLALPVGQVLRFKMLMPTGMPARAFVLRAILRTVAEVTTFPAHDLALPIPGVA